MDPLAKRLFAVAEELGLTSQALADELGVTESTLSRLRTGNRRVGGKVFRGIIGSARLARIVHDAPPSNDEPRAVPA